MSTLDECFEKAGGKFPFKVNRDYISTSVYWNVEYKLSNGDYAAICNSGESDMLYNCDDNWKLYEEPKPKVKMWRWLIQYHAGYYETNKYFETKEEAQEGMDYGEVIKPLLYTEIEI